MTVYIGSDHAGYQLKEQVKRWLQQQRIRFVDVSAAAPQQEDDYPLFAVRVSKQTSKKRSDRGLLFCGNAQGVCIAANKVRGIRAAVGYSVYGATTSRQDDDSNVLCLAGRVLTSDQAVGIIHSWLSTPFSRSARHQRRLQQIRDLESEQYQPIEIIPSILVSNLSQFKARLHKIEKFFPLAQLDVADGTLVSNTTFSDWKTIRKINTDVGYDLHLMVARPDLYWKNITITRKIYRAFFHIESGVAVSSFIRTLRQAGVRVGLAINPDTPLSRVKPWLSKIDAILVLAVQPGFNNGKFIPTTINRVRTLRKWHKAVPIVIDGGMNPATAKKVLAAGASALVVGSYLSQSRSWDKALRALRQS